jgi:hypothetical protein
MQFKAQPDHFMVVEFNTSEDVVTPFTNEFESLIPAQCEAQRLAGEAGPEFGFVVFDEHGNKHGTYYAR